MTREVIETTNAQGDRIISMPIWSNLLFGLSIDTYGKFSNDSWIAETLEGFKEQGKPSNYEDYDWKCDSQAVAISLAHLSMGNVLEQLINEGVLVSAACTNISYIYAPATAYEAQWTLNATKLEEFLTEKNWDIDAYVKEYHDSYDGFISFIPSWLQDEDSAEFATYLMQFDAYLRYELDTENHDFYLIEELSYIYDKHTAIS